jgi:hypothetical protein
MRQETKKALLFAAILIGAIVVVVVTVIFVLARTGVLQGIDHL